MTKTTRETPEVAVPTAEQVEADTRKRLEDAKSKIDPKASAMELIQNFLKDYKTMSHEEKTKRILSIILTITIGNLFGLKQKPEEVLGTEPAKRAAGVVTEGTDAPTEDTPSKDDTKPQTDQDKKPTKKADPTPAFDTSRFKSGTDIVQSIKQTFSGVEITGGAVPLKTSIAKNRPGAPGWTKKSTDNWDYKDAGNTDEEMEKGNYCIQSITAPDGYTREGTDSVPSETAKKLTQIAIALRTDPRMSLFTGIAMKVDGVEIMMVKEIHMHKRGTASNYLCQPHTGVSYIMKKK